MKKNIKKIVSFSLILSLVFSNIPIRSISFAQDKNTYIDYALYDDIKMDESLFFKSLEYELNNCNFKNSKEREETRRQVLQLFNVNKTNSVVTFRSIIPEHMGIGKKAMGIGLNMAIAALVGGVGAGAVKTYIIKEGKESAKRMFYKTIRSRLMAWGATKFAFSLGVAVDYILEYSDFGSKLADLWDANDAVPNNDWCEIY